MFAAPTPPAFPNSCSPSLFSVHSEPSALRKNSANPATAPLPPRDSKWCHPERSEGSAFFPSPLATRHSPLATKPFTIRTYRKHARNPFRIRTYKTQDLKPFRMNTYKKTGGGPPSSVLSAPGSPQSGLSASSRLQISPSSATVPPRHARTRASFWLAPPLRERP